MYLLDTNILAELRKGRRCHPALADWMKPVAPEDLYTSVLVLGEIRKGIELLARRDPRSAAALEQWLTGLRVDYADRILEVTLAIADEWGRLNAIRPLPATDSLMAATAKVHGLILVTRNQADLANIGVRVLNPFAGQP